MKTLSLIAILIAAQLAEAQSTNLSGSNLSAHKSFSLFVAKTSEQTELLAMKFGQFDSAKVQYSRKVVRIITHQQSDGCSTGSLCANNVATLSVELPVLRIERQECADVYYAQTSANAKSKVFEEVKVIDNNVDRCMYIQEQYNEVIYRITGSPSNASANEMQREWIHFLSRPLVTDL